MARPQALTAAALLGLLLLPHGATASLSLTPPSTVTFGPVTLSGADTSTTAQPVLAVSDTDLVSSGWNLTLSTTALSGPGGASIPDPALSVPSAPTVACTGAGGVCAATPVNAVLYPVAFTQGGAAVKWFSAAAASGLGSFDVTPTLQLALPAGVRAGSYSATLTWSITAGP
jgi:hypothetical protein